MITYNNSPYYGCYVNFAHWCNQPSFFFNYSLRDFVFKYDDYNKMNGRSAVMKYFNQINTDEFKEYLYVKPKELVIDY